jgi:hypothetical protein
MHRPAPVADGRDSPHAPAPQRASYPETISAAAAPAEHPQPAQNASVANAPASPAFAAAAPAAGHAHDGVAASGPASSNASPSEAALLLRARRALASDPAGALRLTEEHARLFPSGTLVPEREVLAIEALARLGRSDEARQRLDALRANFPNAANVSHLEAVIGR